MDASVATALIAAAGAIVLAGASYWFTKRSERHAELRREKLAHYKDFTLALSGIISGEQTPDGQRAFARACNALNLVAPQPVLVALQRFQEATKSSNATPASREQHDALMSVLFLEMRKDLGVTPGDNVTTFRVGLWASGQKPG